MEITFLFFLSKTFGRHPSPNSLSHQNNRHFSLPSVFFILFYFLTFIDEDTPLSLSPVQGGRGEKHMESEKCGVRGLASTRVSDTGSHTRFR